MIKPGDIISSYEVIDELGSGGFGRVYLCRHPQSGEKVALKVLHAKFTKSAKFREMIINEALLLAKLEHPNICNVKNFAIHNDDKGENYCIIMEYIEGKPLDEIIDNEGLIPPERAVPLFMQVFAGIGYAHQRGIVHRDIKPQNIMVMKNDGVKVMDFGIARMMESAPVMDSMSAVSFGYVAPERVSRQAIDKRSDIYSLGMTMYQALTARLPFEINDFDDLKKHLTEKPASPKSFYPYMSRELAGVVLKSIEKNPERRFQSCEEFALALQQLGSNLVEKIEVAAKEKPAEMPESVIEEKKKTFEGATEKRRFWRYVFGAIGILLGILSVLAVLEKVFLPIRGFDAGKEKVVDVKEMTVTEVKEVVKGGTGYTSGGMEMVFIQGGCYRMGCVAGDGKCANNEKPSHKVCVNDFFLSKTEVTVGQFEECVNKGGCSKSNYATKSDNSYCNFGYSDRKNHPMNCVNWHGAKEFVNWLSKKTGENYRLATEAEWEYAAKNQGKDVIYPWGDFQATCNYAVMDDGGNGCGKDRTWEVCSKPKGNTEQGLCDMSGNVWEWVEDWFDEDYYKESPSQNPEGPASGTYKVLRGGSWGNDGEFLRASNRYWVSPDVWYYDLGLGFRAARTKN